MRCEDSVGWRKVAMLKMGGRRLLGPSLLVPGGHLVVLSALDWETCSKWGRQAGMGQNFPLWALAPWRAIDSGTTGVATGLISVAIASVSTVRTFEGARLNSDNKRHLGTGGSHFPLPDCQQLIFELSNCARVFSLDDPSAILSPLDVAFLETDDVESDEDHGPQRSRLDTPRLQATSAVPHRVHQILADTKHLLRTTIRLLIVLVLWRLGLAWG
ncbi:hypothetical protein QBC39DRAFT_1034 [Podospora conica]|nr:hypothetical protein QBC39DRAFT_1034 [Schizothecium conicum]